MDLAVSALEDPPERSCVAQVACPLDQSVVTLKKFE